MKKIMIDQCGYLSKISKKVTIISDKPVPFCVMKSSGVCVYEGVADQRVVNEAASEVNYLGDFSQVEEEGIYMITAEQIGESDLFTIGNHVYEDVLQKAIRFFYLQRCGETIPESEDGIYGHAACHTSMAKIYGTDQYKEVNGGWHDAGDYGRYVGPGAMSVAQLLLAYERDKAVSDLCSNPVHKGESMPAYLQEIKYEIDWMLKMQSENGEVYHKVSCYNFCGFIMPEEEKEELVISPVSVTATADFAAACAMAVRFYRPYDEVYADKLTEASMKAYEALKKMDMPGGFKNPPNILTGEYGDVCDEDERYWAAAELYKAFGKPEYGSDFEKMANQKIYQGYGWEDMGSYGNQAYLTATFPVDGKLKKKIEQAILSQAEELLETVKADGYGTSLKKTEYIWGSNLSVCNRGVQMMDAYRLTGKKEYLDAAWEQVHYLFGRNPMGICYLTGCGTDAVKRPHHRPSGAKGKAMPGMLSGGPSDWLADELAKQILSHSAPAKCFLDMMGSYSTNEVTVYWNSALVLLMASVLEKN